ncbi:MAG: hypothetical protein NW226_05025 [Microscillaceae bacterium]|nr:hypothetical protein [Microscillaceae bacterium]
MKNIRDPKEFPPFFKTWNQIYIAVLIQLGLVVFFLYWFSMLYR